MVLHSFPQFNSMLLGYFVLVIATGRMIVREDHRRAWILSAFASTIMSIGGSIEVVLWALAESSSAAMAITPLTNMLLEFLKVYLLVDLVYCSFWHPYELGLLDGWIHHIVYIVFAEKILQDYQAGSTRPFWIMEIPAAIRAWKALGIISPAIGTQWFAATFLAFRIIWPMYAITQLVTLSWVFVFMGTGLTIHIVWFVKWIHSFHI